MLALFTPQIVRTFLLVLATGLFTSGCEHKPGPELRFGLSNMPANLDPRYATDAASSRIDRLLYQRLVDFDNTQRPVPSIANWTVEEPTRYRFKLNQKATPFHNGDILKADDVKATYDYILNKDNASPHRASLTIIDNIKVINDSELEFNLNRPDPLFPAYLLIGIVPEKLIRNSHPFENHPIGSGPFQFSEWPQEGKLRIQRVSDKLKVEFIHVPNPTVRVLKLMRGEIDMLQNDLPPELVTYLESRNNVNVQRQTGSNFAYLGFNMEDPVLGDLRVRQAIAYSINKQAIIQHVFGNSARAANALLPPTHWAGNDALESYAYNPEKAKALLKEAGYGPDHRLPLSYKTSSDPFRIRLATIMQSNLSEVGIDMDIRSYDWGTFYGDIKAGRFQLYSLAWIGIKTPDIFRYVLHSSAVPPAGANRGRYNNPEIDRLIESAERQPDLLDQAKFYKELQHLVLKELPYVPLWYEDHVFISNKRVQNYHLVEDGDYDGLLTVQIP